MRYLKIVFMMFVVMAAAVMGPLDLRAQTMQNTRFGLVNAYEAPTLAAESGAGWELLTVRWADLQPDGVDQWQPDSSVDTWLDTARAQGREVVIVLRDTPAWAAEEDPITGPPAGLYLPISESGNLWAGFVREAVNYYSAQGVNRYVIWQEQDIPTNRVNTTWTGSLEDYYQMVKVAYQVANDANPNAQIHLGGVTYTDPGWFGRFMREVVNDPTAAANEYYFDVASLQVFGSPEDVYIRTGSHYGVMAQSGIPAKPVWINALNARPTEDPVYTGDEFFSPFPNVTLDQQRSFIIQAYALGFAAGAERIAVYQLQDDLQTDDGEAYGLIRADSTIRPAYESYQLSAELLRNTIFERRVDEEAFPFVEYVRFTAQERVIHVAWGRTDTDTATLTIPARTEEATLIRVDGQSWVVKPENGAYAIVVEGATCNDPVYTCLIGGRPWMLIEEGVEDAIDSPAPPVTVSEGGQLPTPPAPTEIPPTPTSEPTELPEEAAGGDTNNNAERTPSPTASPTSRPATAVAEAPDDAEQTDDTSDESDDSLMMAQIESNLQPTGFMQALPFILWGLGVVIILSGVAYYFQLVPVKRKSRKKSQRRSKSSSSEEKKSTPKKKSRSKRRKKRRAPSQAETREHHKPTLEPVTGLFEPSAEEHLDEGGFEEDDYAEEEEEFYEEDDVFDVYEEEEAHEEDWDEPPIHEEAAEEDEISEAAAYEEEDTPDDAASTNPLDNVADLSLKRGKKDD